MTLYQQLLCGTVVVAWLSWAPLASAYRPFDGTDADVAEPSEVELEVGPAAYQQEGGSRFIVAPALIANYGFLPGFEAVLEGRRRLSLNAAPRVPQVEEVAFSIKSLLRPGSLQGRGGLSVALEIGMLLPGSGSRLGTHVGSIFSLRLPALTLHLNLANDFLYSVRYDASASFIVEGPNQWRLRPVAELLMEREFAQGRFLDGVAESVLIGGIARWTDALSFDFAGRLGHGAGQRQEELRAGLTWAFVP